MAAIDNFSGRPGAAASYTAAGAVTPSDTVSMTNVSRALMNTGTAGIATCIMADGQTAIIHFALGVMVPVRVSRVNATSLGAGVSLVAFW